MERVRRSTSGSRGGTKIIMSMGVTAMMMLGSLIYLASAHSSLAPLVEVMAKWRVEDGFVMVHGVLHSEQIPTQPTANMPIGRAPRNHPAV